MNATSTKRFAPRQFDFNAEDLNRFRHVERMGWMHIAKQYGCHHSTVIYACKRLGVALKLKLRVPAQRPQVTEVSEVPSEKDAA